MIQKIQIQHDLSLDSVTTFMRRNGETFLLQSTDMSGTIFFQICEPALNMRLQSRLIQDIKF